MSRPSKKIVCRVRFDEQAKTVEFTWSEGSASFKPYALEGEQVADFRANVKSVRDRLFSLVKHHGQPLEERDPALYGQTCLELALAGHDLYNQIFDPAARDGESVDTIAGWLRDVTNLGDVESLEVVCDDQPWFAPWNLIYDKEPDESAFDGDAQASQAGFAPFWGMRYNVCGGQPVDPLRRMPLPTKPLVLAVIDPVVLDDLRGYADSDGLNQRDRLERFLNAQGLTPVTSTAALAKALKQQRPHIIYWLGHADPDALHLGPEKLDQTALRNLLRNMIRVPRQTGGLVFLNACRTAESGNLGSFLKTFHNAEFSGLIATEEQTLDSFANPFGLGVLERFFTPGTSIGGVLRDLRQIHGPLGLLYGAYCPPDLHVRPMEEPGAPPNVRLANDPTFAGGRTLGASPARSVGEEAPTRDRPLPEAPYLPLDSYGQGHRPLFVGRDDDITRFAMILDHRETRVLALHGGSGVGKSSFLRAGLIPYLEEYCIGYRFLRNRARDEPGNEASPVLFIRATDDPASQIAQALVDFTALPLKFQTPTGETAEVNLPALLAREMGATEFPSAATVAARLLVAPSLLARVLVSLSSALPVTLVLVIDQAEEMFTLARAPTDVWSRDRVLEMIRQVAESQGDFKLIVALRTEYYGRLVSALRRGLAEADGVRDYLLTDLDVPAMIEVIRRPTAREHLPHTGEVPFEKYGGFDYDEGVPEQIAHQIAAHGRTDGVALLLQVICAQIFELAMSRDDHRVTMDDLSRIGGFEGALSRHAERQIATLFPEMKSDRERFQVLLTCLTLSQVDGTLTTALLREDDLRRLWDGRQPFDTTLLRACELRLLRTTTRRLDTGSEERLVSLGHDALAKVAHPWKQELERQAERRKWQIRGGVAVAAAVIFALISFKAIQETKRSTRAETEALKAYAAEAKDREYAEEQRNRAVKAQNEARANEEKAEIAAATARVNARRAEEQAEQSREHLVRLHIGNGTRLLNDVDYRSALLYFTEALALDQGRPEREEIHRRRIGAILAQSIKNSLILFQDGQVNDAEFSPDGRRIVTASSRKQAQVWDAVTGAPITPPLVHGDRVRVAGFSPDGHKIFTIGDDRAVRVWNADTGEAISAPLEHDGVVNHAAFSPDSLRLATACADHKARIWNVDAAKPATPPLELHHDAEVWVVTFSPDGARVVTGSYDKTGRVWEATTGRPISSPLHHDNWVEIASFSPDGRKVVTASRDQTARVWDAVTGAALCPPLHHSNDLLRVSFTPDGHRVVTVAATNEARLWDAATGKPVPLDVMGTWSPHPRISSDGRFHLYTPRLGQDTLIDDNATGKPVILTLQKAGSFWDASFSPDGLRIATACDDKTARVWDAASGAPISPVLQHPDTVSHIRWNQAGTRIVTTSNAEARVWDAASGKPASPPLKHGERIWGASFSPNGRLVVTASADDTGQVWDAETGAKVGQPLKHRNDLTFAVFSPDGSRVLTGSRDNTAQLWDPMTGRPLTPPLKHSSLVRHADFSPDGQRVVTASDDHTARVWNVMTAESLNLVMSHRSAMTWAVFSPDGLRIATAGSDQTAMIWDAGTGQPRTPPLKHLGTVRTVAFSPDGKLLVTTCDDKTVRIWDAATGDPVSAPMKHSPGWVRHAVFSTDGARVLTATSTRKLATWDIPRDDRPVHDLILLAQLISAARLDPLSGLVPCDAPTLNKSWRILRDRYPDSFTSTPAQVLSWNRHEAEAAEAAGIWPRAVQHLQVLVSAATDSGLLHARQGRALLELRNWDKAVEELTRALDLHAQDPDLLYYRGRAHAHRGQWEKAREDYSRLLDHEPNNAPVLLLRNLANAHMGAWDKADADFSQAVIHSQAVRPRVDCWWNDRAQGRTLSHMERWQELAADFAVTTETEKREWWELRGQALTLAALDRWKDAVSSYTEAIGRKPDDWESWRGRGRAYAELGQWRQAGGDCSRAIALRETDWGAWYLRGIAHSGLGQYDEAVKDFTEALNRKANGWGVHVQRGYASSQLQDNKSALADYTEAIRLTQNATVYNNRGAAFAQMGEFDKAIADFDEAIRLSAKYALPFTNRGDAYRKKGDLAKAISDSLNATQLQPSLLLAFVNLGDAYSDRGEFDKAIFSYTEVLDRQPNNASVFRRRAAACLSKKDFEGAIADDSEVLRLNPLSANDYLVRSKAYLESENYGKAVADGAEAMRLDPVHKDVWSILFKNSEQAAHAEKFIREDLARQEKLVVEFPSNPSHRRDLAESHSNLGHLYQSARRFQEAEKAYRQGLTVRENLAAHLPDPGYREDLARSQSSLGDFLKERGQLVDAERLYQKAGGLWRKLAADYPVEPRYLESLAQSFDDLGIALRDSNQLREAEELILHGITIKENLVIQFPNEGKYQQAVIRGLGILAKLKSAVGQVDEAEKVSRVAVARAEKLAAEFATEPEYQVGLASDYTDRGDLLLGLGRTTESEKAYRQALAVRERLLVQFPEEPFCQNGLAWPLAICPIPECRDAARANTLAEKAVKSAPNVGTYWNTLGVARYRKGDWKGTIEALEKSMDLRFGGDSYDWFFLAMAHWQLGQRVPARQFFDRAVEGIAKTQPNYEERRRFHVEAAALLGIELPKQPERSRAN